MDTRTEPVRASEATPELVAPELQAKMVAAFERARAEELAVQLPEDGADSASDPGRGRTPLRSWSSSANARWSRRAFPGTTGAAETVTGT